MRLTQLGTPLLLFFGCCLSLLFFRLANHVAHAQGTNNDWSRPQQVIGYDDETAAPYLVADQNKTVHAFNSLQLEDELVIVYSQWTAETGWTLPVDIILPPHAGIARISGAFLDAAGIMHLVFYSGNEQGAEIYYSRAAAVDAGRALAWSAPLSIGVDAGSPMSAPLAGDGQGNLFVLYSGRKDGIGLYAVRSTDSGHSWSEPATVYLTNSDSLWPHAVRLALDSQGALHAVWSTVNVAGNGVAVYYASLVGNQEQPRLARRPIILAEAVGYEADWPSIISYNDELFVVYQNDSPATRWFRRSSDGGQSWTASIRPFPHVGEYDRPFLLIDGSNSLHMLLGNRTGNPEIHGMWRSVWQGERWSDLEAITSSLRVVAEVGGAGFDPTAPQAVISQGNTLLVTWVTDPGAGRNGVWSSYTVLNAAELPLAPLPTPAPVRQLATAPAALAGIGTAAPAPPPATRPAFAVQNESERAAGPVTPLVLGAAPAALLVLAVIVIYGSRQRSAR